MRIVIVDSEETSREVIKQAINTVVETHKIKSGCKIVGEAADGRKGCEIIVKERPDLIIMDLELPGKNGLPLLKKIRSEQIHSRVLVITKDNDFDRTRQAISFGVDEYLLKPVKKVQIAKALKMIEDKLAGELVIETALSVENIFMACLNGQIHRDEIVDGITHEKYGFTLADRGNLFVVWLGNGYMEQREMTQKILEKLGQNQEFSVCVLPIDEWHLFTVIIYGPEKKTIRYPFFKNEVVSRLSGMIRGELVCLWEDVVKSGPACHTGAESCFFNEVYVSPELKQFSWQGLYQLIKGRKDSPKEGSYTTYLFEKGKEKILKKVGEECTEVIIAGEKEDKAETIYEISDLAYHVLVLMVQAGITVEEITRELEKRHVIDHKVKQERMQ